MESSLKTRNSLIQRVKLQSNEEAWDEFVHYYRPFINYILRKINISSNDIDDLIQETLIRLWKSLPSYEKKNAKFRTWLTTLIRNSSYDFFRKRDAYERKLEQNFQILLPQNESELELKIEKEWEAYITRLALDKMREIFRGKAVDVFEMSLQGHTADEIAAKLTLTPQTVYTLKTRVKSYFMGEVKRLIEELEF